MLAAARSFFAKRDILEVDCPILGQSAPIDLHIDVMEVPVGPGVTGFLHTSPEYAMKRLISEGIGDIYHLGHVFRQNEIGPLHNPEFTMAEWYRHGLSYETFIEETVDFIRLFLGDLPVEILTYREALSRFAGFDYLQVDCKGLIEVATNNHLTLSDELLQADKDTLLQLLMSLLVEPHLGQDKLSVINYFPASQAALAKTCCNQEESVAKRFEIYFKGIELANGYDELADAEEQRIRLQKSQDQRIFLGKSPLKIDEQFIKALEKGFPDCRGVAVGFDRLMMLRHQKNSLTPILPFSWEEA
jgi:lysyl-tRNA synthetase class 2